MPQMKPFRGIMLDNSHPLTRGLVGLWPFNEEVGNKVFDLSGNRNTGSLIADTHWVPSKFGSALDFDGTNDYVIFGSANLLDNLGVGGVTFSIWVNPSAASNGTFLDKRLWSLQLDTLMRIRFFLDASGSPMDKISQTVLTVGKWNHIVIVWDGSFLAAGSKFYVDGIELTSFSIANNGSGTINDSAFDLRAGTRSDLFVDYNGLLDHIAIYNRTLSASEIALLYQEPFAMFEKARIPFLIPAVPAISPNLTDRNNYNGYLAFIQQYIKHKINATDPWANPQGDLL